MLKKLWNKRATKLIIVCLGALIAFLAFDFYTSGTTYGSNSAAAQTPSDVIAPTILGDAVITLERGETFEPANHFTVTDDQDENPTLEVQTAVDTSVVGVTPVLLTAKDELGNTSTKQITVNVIDTAAEEKAKAEEQAKKEQAKKEQAEKKAAEEKAAKEQEEIAAQVENTQQDTPSSDFNTNETESRTNKVASNQSQNNAQPANTNSANTNSAPAAPTTIQPMQLEINGKLINYQNAGQGSGQAIIDADHSRAATWGGAPVQSGDDGLNTHIIAHNPGAFDVIFSLGIGSQIRISDASGKISTYTVGEIAQVDDEAYRLSDGADYWDKMIGTGGGERVTLQACINDIHNLVIFAYK
ncbi:hypothetical protein EsVE80_20780 [Enterococcus saigonensis]|uniref:Pesticidal crystal protein Cry22Aa Ig-like domain-containing protein n=1 Tax=Enterococcus saigonensis TaxID=1805431 RepID=A0A679IM03_9ENTE|nr:immunoglobulin-like domain-containing protein [Enterococcus saigonensis]BCA86555.1 hypothetical protein EsVE80_20780 [Enterococcus saigonensis]